MKSKRLKKKMRRTGIQVLSRQLITSDSMPGKRLRVTKYVTEIEIRNGQTDLNTSHLATQPPAKRKQK